ncbi:TetR/AcrR family transcriptional regulator [uncultured Methylobacterium sp.]|uniref:TetR/AcrR family transcriptional regulator n=1 Tax=uncultured Methylobacterium sp. TaxID=157278 RepID=UPI0025947EF7|nr:TetR/AcrR family transcriptional regulator [uncultured Methylobacterium sp.]
MSDRINVESREDRSTATGRRNVGRSAAGSVFSSPSDRPRRLGRPPRGTEGDITVRILDAATEVFLAEGYEASSIDAIATAAAISKKTFYARFASKADLFEAAATRFIEQRILPPIEQEASRVGSTHECLRAIATAVLGVVLTPEAVALDRIVTAEARRFPDLARAVHEFGMSRVLPAIERCLEEGVRRGEIAVPDIRFTADYFLNSLCRPPLYRAVLGLERPELTHVKREQLGRALDLFMRGCQPHRDGPRAPIGS